MPAVRRRACRWRRLVKYVVVSTLVLWLASLALLHLSLLSGASLILPDSLLDSLYALLFLPVPIDPPTLRALMAPDPLEEVASPLGRLVVRGAGLLSYYALPLRRAGVTYSEITTANRDTRLRLAPDFTYHGAYRGRELTLYEDRGPGCVFRIFLYPSLPTDASELARVGPSRLAALSLLLRVDGHASVHTLDRVMAGTHAPFLAPLSTSHASVPAAGLGAYTPLCYQRSLEVVYRHDAPLPPHLLEAMVNCSAGSELRCPVKVYSAVSRHKYPYGTLVSPWVEGGGREVEAAASLLARPEVRGPDGARACALTCVTLCVGCQRVIHHTIHTPGVISALKLRVYSGDTQALLTDWMDFFLLAYFDDPPSPQVDRVPLGSIFGAAGSLNDHRGAAFGRRARHCALGVEWEGLPRHDMTGYLYYPMPYWEEALLVIERGGERRAGRGGRDPIVCYEVTTVDNHYARATTAHFYARKTYYSGEDVSRYRAVVDVRGGWGQLVGVGVEIDNLRAARGGSLAARWAPLQADPLIYVDGAPAVLGTGLEDYFSFAHGFQGVGNVTYAFVGCYHASPPQRLEPLTFHAYRQHVLDPVTFRRSLRFVMEGVGEEEGVGGVGAFPAPSLTHDEHATLKRAARTTLAHVAYFYFSGDQAGAPPGGTSGGRGAEGRGGVLRERNLEERNRIKIEEGGRRGAEGKDGERGDVLGKNLTRKKKKKKRRGLGQTENGESDWHGGNATQAGSLTHGQLRARQGGEGVEGKGGGVEGLWEAGGDCDVVWVGDPASEALHQLRMSSPHSDTGQVFRLTDVHYLGDSASNLSFSRVIGRAFAPGDTLSFVMTPPSFRAGGMANDIRGGVVSIRGVVASNSMGGVGAPEGITASLGGRIAKREASESTRGAMALGRSLGVPVGIGGGGREEGRLLVLRRLCHAQVGAWNEAAAIVVDGRAVGEWFIAMGTLSELYSLRADELTLLYGGRQGEGPGGQGAGPGGQRMRTGGSIEIIIRPRSVWRDVAYQLCTAG